MRIQKTEFELKTSPISIPENLMSIQFFISINTTNSTLYVIIYLLKTDIISYRHENFIILPNSL